MSEVPGSAEQRRYGSGLSPIVAESKDQLAKYDAELAERYWRRENVDELVANRSAFMDGILERLWLHHVPPPAQNDLALLAVGGYGRNELFPHSDIDLLVLAKRPAQHQSAIRGFLHSLYDLNLEVGHAVRQPRDCKRAAQDDITVATAIFERRFMTGSLALSKRLDKALSGSRLWPVKEFFKAKRNEQNNRHDEFDNVEYGLEPNLKSSPGGLRDLQTAMWVCQRKFGTTDPKALQDLGMLTSEERERLDDGRRYLWWVRFGLHILAGRKEDRLLFEHQRSLAQRLGFADTSARLGVERFMHLYYRHVLELREVNDILLQHFDESILRSKERPRIESVNESFQIRNDYIEAKQPRVFSQTPSALLELFVIMANRRDISGVRAETIRLIRDNLDLIDEEFRNDPLNTTLFIELLKAPYTLVSQLTRMRRYGILGRYLPEFGEIIGQMQHDLFHIYTVDAHTMMVIRNMRRFHYRSSQESFPVACHCVKAVPKIELLYIAGLYHDIGKGRGGDHSELGADYVSSFCRRHGLNDSDTSLVQWLVKSHLLMSSVAQRQDIYDPEVIHEFASEVKSEMRLDYLYALTVADINATNPTLWNSWRATLLRQLYGETRKALRRGLELPVDRQARVRACMESAEEKLITLGLSEARIHDLWQVPNDDFFLRHTPRQVAEVAHKLHQHDIRSGPMIALLDLKGQVSQEGATEVLVFTKDRANLFAASVIALNKLELSIYDANIHTSEDGLCLNTFVVLNAEGRPLSRNGAVRERVCQRMAESLAGPDELSMAPPKRLPRRLRQFTNSTEARLRNPDQEDYSVLTIVAADRPGLLATIGLLFAEFGLGVLSAKIATLGERVEDVFQIVGQDGAPIRDEETIYLIENTLRQRLDQLVNQRP